jgi:hypothetical protein
VSLRIRVENRSPGSISLYYLTDDWSLSYGGAQLDASLDITEVSLAPGANERVTVSWYLGSVSEIDLVDTTLVMGTGDSYQSSLLLAPGATAQFDPITPLAISGRMSADEDVDFVVERAIKAPFGCHSSGAWGEAIPRREATLIITGRMESVGARTQRFTPNLVLRLPDGTTSAGNPGVNHVVSSGDTVRDVQACFLVPSDLPGEYVLTTTRRLQGPPSASDFAFSVP